jgi:hypothetical protein
MQDIFFTSCCAKHSRISKSIIIQLDIYILLCTAQQHIGQLKDEIYFLLHLQQHGRMSKKAAERTAGF